MLVDILSNYGYLYMNYTNIQNQFCQIFLFYVKIHFSFFEIFNFYLFKIGTNLIQFSIRNYYQSWKSKHFSTTYHVLLIQKKLIIVKSTFTQNLKIYITTQHNNILVNTYLTIINDFRYILRRTLFQKFTPNLLTYKR